MGREKNPTCRHEREGGGGETRPAKKKGEGDFVPSIHCMEKERGGGGEKKGSRKVGRLLLVSKKKRKKKREKKNK